MKGNSTYTIYLWPNIPAWGLSNIPSGPELQANVVTDILFFLILLYLFLISLLYNRSWVKKGICI